MEEIEPPTEHLHEHLHHAAHGGERWISWVALSSAILAAIGAVCALLSGHHANEAMIDQIQASNKWAYFQSKSVKANLLSSKMELLDALGKKGGEKDHEKLAEYKKEQNEIAEEAKHKEQHSADHLRRHLIFARALTLLQVSIAVSAISALSQRRGFWFVSLVFGAAGSALLLFGLK